MKYVLMLTDITVDETCRKGDICEAEYLYDGKLQLLNKVGDENPIEYQCYEEDVEYLSEEEVEKKLKSNKE